MKRNQMFFQVVLSTLLLFVCSLFAGGRVVAQVACDNVPVALPSAVVPGFDESQFGMEVSIEYDGNSAKVGRLPQGVEAVVDGAAVRITSFQRGVEYCVSGNAPAGSLTVVSEHSPLITFDDLSLSSVGSDAVQVSSKGIIYVRVKGTSRLADFLPGTAPKQDAVLKLMGRALLFGDGALTLAGERGSALLATDTLYIAGAEMTLSSTKRNALFANRSLVIGGGSLNATAGKDVMKVNGAMFVNGGAVRLCAELDKVDGVQAGALYLRGGSLFVNVAGAAADGMKSKGELCILGGDVAVEVSGSALYSEKKFDYSSPSCIKGDSTLYIAGGNLSFVATGDGGKGISCDGNSYFYGGNVYVLTKGADVNHPVDINAHTSSKGIKCDKNLYIGDCTVEVVVAGSGERAEGIEAKGSININDGADVYVYAYDDAFNAAKNFIMNGGRVFAYSVANDALDSNGPIEINGGLLVADGSFTPEQGIDTDNLADFVARGGTFLSVGGSMGPYPGLPLGKETKVNVVAWRDVELKKGDYVTLSSADGGIITYQLARDNFAGTVVVSHPSMKGCDELQLTLSASVTGGKRAGYGLLEGAEPVDEVLSVELEQKALVSVVTDAGVEYVSPDTVTFAGFFPGMFPQPPFGGDSAFAMPPQGMFPRPPFGGDSAFAMPPQGMFPPSFGGNGGFEMPPFAPDGAGHFPPPPQFMRNIENEYSPENLPHKSKR